MAELRRRVHTDPASIAFAQLAEECRRAGSYDEAVQYCRNGLARHPGYLSARVTLGRALIETGALDAAAHEFELVLTSAPDNLAAIRGLADIHQRRGDLTKALEYYDRALSLARFDPELEDTVRRIGREMGTVSPAPGAPGAPSTPGAPSAPSAPSPGAGLIDFDAILASLGVPDATPPPVMEKLLSNPSGPPALVGLPETPLASASNDIFAELERELRAFDAAPVHRADAATTAVLAELEAWLHVLQADRTAQPV